MTTATQRIPVLVTVPEKARISKAARAAGVSMGEYLRQAASAFRPAGDHAVLAGLLDQVRKSTASASDAIDAALAQVNASNLRIEAMELAHRKGPV